MVEIEPDGASEQRPAHAAVSVTFRDAEINAAGKKGGEEYESFCCRNEAKRLV